MVPSLHNESSDYIQIWYSFYILQFVPTSLMQKGSLKISRCHILCPGPFVLLESSSSHLSSSHRRIQGQHPALYFPIFYFFLFCFIPYIFLFFLLFPIQFLSQKIFFSSLCCVKGLNPILPHFHLSLCYQSPFHCPLPPIGFSFSSILIACYV